MRAILATCLRSCAVEPRQVVRACVRIVGESPRSGQDGVSAVLPPRPASPKEPSMTPSDHPAVPRRPRRQPAAPAAPARRPRAARATARLDDDALRAVEDDAIREVVRRCRSDVGLQTATDGEFRRTSWHMDFIYSLDGISRTDEQLAGEDAQRRRRHRASPRPRSRSTASSASTSRSSATRSAFLKSVVTTGTPKLTIPSPSMVHYRGGPAAHRSGRLPGRGRVLGRPVRRLRRPGAQDRRARAAPTCSWTTPAWPTSTTRRSGREIAAQGRDAEHQHERYIRQINAAIAGPSGQPDRHHAHVPRQLPLVLGGRGRLRLRGRGAVRPARRRRVLPRVRRRALGHASSRCASCPRARWSCSAW